MSVAAVVSRANHRSRHILYRSSDLAAQAENAMTVDVSIESIDIDALMTIIASLASARSRAKGSDLSNAKDVRRLLQRAAAEFFRQSLGAELDKVIERYRQMLHESLATGRDHELRAALNRARLQEKILANTSMADQAEACELLGLSSVNPSATMKRREDKKELLRFTVDGRAAYPLFQFDVEARRVYAAMARLIAMKPASWSDFRLLHWLTRPHLDFDGAPGDALKSDAEAVILALGRETEPAVSG